MQPLPLLLLLAAPAWSAGPFFNILDYGARNDASVPATEAIRSAIQAAKAAGGGTVFIPAGKYVSGPIELVSNLTLHIDAGATVRFPAARLPFTEGRQQSICRSQVESSAFRRVTGIVICLHFPAIPSTGIVLHSGHPSRLPLRRATPARS